MDEHLRVHIVPIGFDSTRVTEPLIQRKADRVYLIRHENDKKSSIYYNFITKELQKKMKYLQINEEFINIWDLYSCIEKFREIILNEKENGNNIFVNVSTGSKITAIAGMLSCMSWKATPYYAHIEYPPQKDITVKKSKIKNDFDELPVYEINKPRQTQLKILNILKNKKEGIRKFDLIDELEKENVIRKKEIKKDSELKIHAKYSQLHQILKPMEIDWKFIETLTIGKRSQVKITDQGIKALKIFGCN